MRMPLLFSRLCRASCSSPILIFVANILVSGCAAASVLMIMRSLRGLPITKLDLGGNVIGHNEAADFAAALVHLPHLTMLGLRTMDLGDEGAAALAPALEGLSRLTAQRHPVGGSTPLCHALHRKEHLLEHLYLGQNLIGIQGAAVLAASLCDEDLVRLRTLNLSGNHIGAVRADAIFTALPSGALQLERLNVYNSDMGEGSACLCLSLPRMPKLRWLNAERNGLDDAAKAALRAGRYVNITLE